VILKGLTTDQKTHGVAPSELVGGTSIPAEESLKREV